MQVAIFKILISQWDFSTAFLLLSDKDDTDMQICAKSETAIHLGVKQLPLLIILLIYSKFSCDFWKPEEQPFCQAID